MGSVSAMSSIDRVIEKHGDELAREYMEQAGSGLVKRVFVSNNIYSVRVNYVLVDDSELEGPEIDIDDLAQRFPDCEIGY